MTESEREFLKLHSDITEAKASFGKGLGELPREIPIEEAQKRLKAGKPVLDFETVELPEEKLRQLFESFSSALKSTQFHEASEVKGLQGAVESGELDLQSLVKDVFNGDSGAVTLTAERLGVDADLLAYLGTNLINPFLEQYTDELGDKVDFSNWLSGSCPFCGSEAAFARLRRDDGKRILWCQFCGTEWEYPRIKCPFCSTENHKSLRYFYTEEQSHYRVYLCDECKRYVKTIDERVTPEDQKLDLAFESFKTLYLDILAQKDGYQNRFASEKPRA